MWVQAAVEADEVPTWRWVRVADSGAIVDGMAKAFGDFSGNVRREVDGLRDSGEASRLNLLLRVNELERRLAELEMRAPAPKARR